MNAAAPGPLLRAGASAEAVAEAAARLAAGGLVAFPTETVYGLGARADDAAAVAAIYAAKGRPADHPLIVHVAEPEEAAAFTRDWPPLAQRLAKAFWPGPLTLILPRRPGLAEAAAGGQDSLGLRCPDHPVARALLRAAAARGVPGVAAPSANRFGRISPTRAAHVLDEFAGLGPEALLVLDGGDCAVGIESTIIDLSRGRPVLLRPGMLGADAVAAVAGEAVQPPDAAAPRASGTLEQHYAPRARVQLMSRAQLQAALDALSPGGPAPAVYARAGLALPAELPGLRMPAEAAAAAQALFADLRRLDAGHPPAIWVETPPDHAEWAGVRDRLRRAAA
ncbi:L-threonylcarbamoyladenylate synthase [Aquariibacter albus]|uniref:L-threonylcarbamoyladenylate synthase n=1 Tax=Aquariibacter albus TaxID=2759899 RepID=UPI0038B3D67B